MITLRQYIDKNMGLFNFFNRKENNKKLNNKSLKRAVEEWFVNKRKVEYKYGPIAKWDVSGVSNMSRLFYGKADFNQPLDNWDVSNVKNMSEMFSLAKSFNQPLDKWDVSNVTDMSKMFDRASAFNQPLDNWDVSNVKNMRFMFSDASSFNQPLNNWDVSNVTDMSKMFNQASAFNQPLDNWDLCNVLETHNLFLRGNHKMIEKYGQNGEQLNSFLFKLSKEKLIEDEKLNVVTKVLCEDGIERVYINSMYGVIKVNEIVTPEIEKRIYEMDMYSNQKITSEFWFSSKGKFLSVNKILHYRKEIKEKQNAYKSKYSSLDSDSEIRINYTQRISHFYYLINGNLFYEKWEPVRTISFAFVRRIFDPKDLNQRKTRNYSITKPDIKLKENNQTVDPSNFKYDTHYISNYYDHDGDYFSTEYFSQIETLLSKMKNVPEHYKIIQERGIGMHKNFIVNNIEVQDQKYWNEVYERHYKSRFDDGSLRVENIKLETNNFELILKEIEKVMEIIEKTKCDFDIQTFCEYYAVKSSLEGLLSFKNNYNEKLKLKNTKVTASESKETVKKPKSASISNLHASMSESEDVYSRLVEYMKGRPNIDRIYSEFTHSIRNGFTVKRFLNEANLMTSDEVKFVASGSFLDIANILQGILEKNENVEIRKDFNALKEAINILGGITADQEYWIKIINVRVEKMPLNSDATKLKRLGGGVDDLGKMHYDEYKTNEPNVPQNKRKEVALNRIEGFLSIRDLIQNNYSKEHKFHLDASIKGALLYAHSLGLNVAEYYDT